jgi:hypothetical protein
MLALNLLFAISGPFGIDRGCQMRTKLLSTKATIRSLA